MKSTQLYRISTLTPLCTKAKAVVSWIGRPGQTTCGDRSQRSDLVLSRKVTQSFRPWQKILLPPAGAEVPQVLLTILSENMWFGLADQTPFALVKMTAVYWDVRKHRPTQHLSHRGRCAYGFPVKSKGSGSYCLLFPLFQPLISKTCFK